MAGSTKARGYAGRHQAVRRTMKAQVEAGNAYCTRCGGHIDPNEPWDADHTDDRTGYLGPAHQHCNRSAGGAKGNQNRRRTPTPRRWKL